MTYKDDTIAERRTKLDGGLNTQDNPFQVRPDQVVAVENFRMYGGSLVLRDGGLFRDYYQTSRPGPAPVISDGGAGSYAADNYQVLYYSCKWGTTAPAAPGDVGPSTASNILALGASKSLLIRISPDNLGLGAGKSSEPYDDPFVSGLSSAQIGVFVKKGAGSYEFQGFKVFVWDDTNHVWAFTLTTYTTGLSTSTPTKSGRQPIRKLYATEKTGLLFAFSPNYVAWDGLNGTFSTTFGGALANAVDSAGNTYYPVSRFPSAIDVAEVNDAIVYTDGFKPKRVNGSTNVIVPSNGYILGAGAPTAVPTLSLIAGGLAGNYYYRMTCIYKTNSGVAAYYSESRPVQSALVAPAGQGVRVTLNCSQAATDLYLVRLYRTKAGGSTYYRLTDIPAGIGTTTFDDNVADGSLGTKTDPDDEGKVTNDTPPATLTMVNRIGSRLIGMTGVYQPPDVGGSDDRAYSFLGGNQARISKPQGGTYADPSGNDTDDCEFSVDHWPNDVDHTLVVGGSAHVTALVSFRGQIYYFKASEIGIITGTEPGEVAADTLFSDTGAIRSSVVQTEDQLYFWNAEKGAYVFSGAAYRWIGTEILDTWLADRDATEPYYCFASAHDRERNSIVWAFTTMRMPCLYAQLDSTQSNLSTIRGSYKQYVYNLDSESWTVYAGATTSRNILGLCGFEYGTLQAPQSKRQHLMYSTSEGLLCSAHSSFFKDPIDETGAVPEKEAITATATLAFNGLGDNWDFVKKWKLCFVALTIGTPTTGSLVIAGRPVQASAFTTIETLTAATVGSSRMQMIRLPDPWIDGAARINADRGLQIKFTSTLDCEVRIHGCELRYTEETPIRAEVRG